jgi:hypothetical protein
MLGGLNPWVIVLVAVFLIFIVCVFSAKKDSAVRAIAYTLILGILFVYILIEHLLPEIRCVHPHRQHVFCFLLCLHNISCYTITSSLVKQFSFIMMTKHIVCVGRHFHPLIPADCLVTEPAKVVAFHSAHGRKYT